MNLDRMKIPRILGRERRAILKRHGFHTIADLLAYCEVREAFSAVSKAIDLDEVTLLGILDRYRRRYPDNGVDFSPLTITSAHFGALVEDASGSDLEKEQTGVSTHTPSLELPLKVDLSAFFKPAFDQGRRGVCVAAAECAAREYEERLVNKTVRLAPQHLYYLCKKHDGHSGSGTYPSVAWKRLYYDGVCRESTWPYNPTPIPGNEGQGPPPAAARPDGLNYRVIRVTAISSTNVTDIKRVLSGHGGQARPASVSIPIKTSFGNSETSRTGKVFMPFPGESTRGWHRILITGYQDDKDAPGGGYFHFLNSWSTQWAHESPIKEGYGLLPYAYFLQYARNVSKMERRPTASLAEADKHSRVSVNSVLISALFWSLLGIAILGQLRSESEWQIMANQKATSLEITSIMDTLFPQ